MELDAKNIARAIAVIVVIAIFAYLYYDRRNVLKQKLNGRPYLVVLKEQITLLKSQLNYMQAIITAHLNLLQNESARAFGEIYAVIGPIYADMERELDENEQVPEVFDEDLLKTVGECKSLFSDLGFQSCFFDVMEAFGDEAMPFAQNEKPLHKAFMQTNDEALQFSAEQLLKLRQKADAFDGVKQLLFARLDEKLIRAEAKGK